MGSLLAQEQSGQPLITEAYIAGSAHLVRRGGITTGEWRSMLPGSSLLQDDLPSGSFEYPWLGPSGYHAADSDGPGITRSSVGAYLAVGVDLDRGAAADARFEKRLRAGITLGGPEQITSVWARSLTGVYDTLVSQATGIRYELDSTWTESYVANLTRSRMVLDGSFILMRNTGRRFSWYVGGGALMGLEHNATAQVERTISRTWEEGLNSTRTEQTSLSEEEFRLDPTMLIGAHGLFGLDFKLGRTSPFWSSLHLFAEWRAGLLLWAYPGLASRASSSGQQAFGLRVDLR